jgi:hypothetical protein
MGEGGRGARHPIAARRWDHSGVKLRRRLSPFDYPRSAPGEEDRVSTDLETTQK